jgi:hypothetical protein
MKSLRTSIKKELSKSSVPFLYIESCEYVKQSDNNTKMLDFMKVTCYNN